jgi:muramoyltetrapeptide carboxypeptidase LdcA involved in peptidoglycan recycling
VLEFFLKGTPWLPPPDFFDGRILFLETAEATTRPAMVRWALRGLGVMGVLDRVAALLLGRPRHATEPERDALEAAALEVVSGDLGRRDLPVVANLDFGHTDPQLVLPLNGLVEVDCSARRLWLAEAALER